MFLLLSSLFLTSAIFVYAHFVGYSSVDEWEIRWGGLTQYSNEWNAGIATWNALGLVNIAPDTIFTIEDLTVIDVNLSDVPWVGEWDPNSSPNTIKLNTFYLYNDSPQEKQNVITHELGHALGLDHSPYGNIMYYTQTNLIALGTHDIWDYNAIYSVPGDNNWHHYAITQIGGTSCANNVNIYIDGVAQSITQWDSGLGGANSAWPLYLGYTLGGYSAVGITDEARIYTRTLSSSEVVDLFMATGPGSVKFTRTGSPDIPCAGFTRSSSVGLTNGICNTTGYSGGAWDVSVTNPNGYTGILPNGFNLTVASVNPLRFFVNLFHSIWYSFAKSENALASTVSSQSILPAVSSRVQKPIRFTKISTFIPPQINLNIATLPWDSLSTLGLNKSTATLPLLIETVDITE